MINGIYHVTYSVRNSLDKLETYSAIFIHCLMMGRQYKRLVVINRIYHVKYSIRNTE